MAIKIELEFSDKDVADLLCSAIEGGFGREWFVLVDAEAECPEGLELAKPWGDEHTPAYIAVPFTSGAALVVHMAKEYIGTPCNTGEAPTAAFAPRVQATYRVTRKELAEGLRIMAAKYPLHFSDFINENADAVTGDVFLQCCTMGEIVFA
jgi:hypothetical protein